MTILSILHLSQSSSLPSAYRSQLRFCMVVTLWFILSLGTSREVLGEKKGAPTSIEAATTLYKEIRKRDPKVTEVERWERAAAPLRQFVGSTKSARDAATGYFLLGRLYETMFRERSYQPGLAQAVYNYEKIARDYEGSELADDALLALGDLRRDGSADLPGARAAYFEIVDRYPKGDRYKEASSRLDDGRAKSTQLGSSESPDVATEELPPAKSTPLLIDLPDPGEGKEILNKQSAVKRPLIVIDAGHGGEDLGAKGVDGILEKEIVLGIAEIFEELLRDRLRARTILTRTNDLFIPLPERTKIANDNNADLFISIHANASELKTASGVETYYLDNTNDRSSLKLAERENLSLNFGGGDQSDLGFMLGDLIQNAKLEDSIGLAHKIQGSLIETLGRYYQGVKNLGVKKAPFYVLVGAHMPCVLVEVSFIDHPLEGKRLAERRYQRLIAQALYQGVRDYFVPRTGELKTAK